MAQFVVEFEKISSYWTFVMRYAPYAYVRADGSPDPYIGRRASCVAFAIDYLCQAYFHKLFIEHTEKIYTKITELADWLLTQQCTNSAKQAYGGFRFDERSNVYPSITACHVIPALLRAYQLTANANYLNAAKNAGKFLQTMQNKPGYGGFARSVTIDGNFDLKMDVEGLYGLIGLKMLGEEDPANKTIYEDMAALAVDFLREGLEGLKLYFDPTDDSWHRENANEITTNQLAYALAGLYEYEAWSLIVEKVYGLIKTVKASAQYPAYNPAIAWASTINVENRFPTSEYYDSASPGILWKIRRDHDKPAFAYSMQVIDKHQDEFMFERVDFAGFGPAENKRAMVPVCWLGEFYLNYSEPNTRFTRILRSKGENVQLYPVKTAAEKVTYAEPLDIQALISQMRAEELLLEPGYVPRDYIAIHTFTPIRHHDKIRRKGTDYEVLGVQVFNFNGEPMYFRATGRRLIA